MGPGALFVVFTKACEGRCDWRAELTHPLILNPTVLKQQQIENFFINLRRRDPRRKPNKVETSSFASSAGSPSPRDGSPEPIPRHSSNPDSGTTPRAPPSGHRPTPFRSAVDSTSTRQARPTSPFNQSGTPSGHHHRAKSPPLPPYLFGPTEIEPEEAFGPASSASSSHSSSFWSAEGSASYSPHSEHSSYGQISPLDYLDSVWPTPETYSTSASAMPRRLPKVHVDPTTYYPNNFQGYCGNPYFLSEETNYHHPYSITPSDSTFHPGYFDEHRGTPKPAPSVAQHYHQRD